MLDVDKRTTRHCHNCAVHPDGHKLNQPVHLVRLNGEAIGDIRPITKRWGRSLENVGTFFSAWLYLPDGMLRFLGNSHGTLDEASAAIEGSLAVQACQ